MESKMQNDKWHSSILKYFQIFLQRFRSLKNSFLTICDLFFPGNEIEKKMWERQELRWLSQIQSSFVQFNSNSIFGNLLDGATEICQFQRSQKIQKYVRKFFLVTMGCQGERRRDWCVRGAKLICCGGSGFA